MTTKEIKSNEPYLYNSWRAILYTSRGKSAGVDERWKNLCNFFEDVRPTYFPNARLNRKNTDLPFGPNNFHWVTDLDSAQNKKNTIHLTYNGETKTLRQWSEEYGMTYNGIKKRYNSKNYSVEEILFGKKKRIRVINPEDNIRTRASKLLSTYKLKDWKSNREFNLDKEWFIENILKKRCIYCGDTNRIGCDRIDNTIGHITDNVVPCCYRCNTTRNRNFSFEEMKILGKTIKKIIKNRSKL